MVTTTRLNSGEKRPKNGKNIFESKYNQKETKAETLELQTYEIKMKKQNQNAAHQ